MCESTELVSLDCMPSILPSGGIPFESTYGGKDCCGVILCIGIPCDIRLAGDSRGRRDHVGRSCHYGIKLPVCVTIAVGRLAFGEILHPFRD